MFNGSVPKKLGISSFKGVLGTEGRYGYEGASIVRITARAKVALRTFYRHFRYRQEFFDQLLPAMGHTLMSFV